VCSSDLQFSAGEAYSRAPAHIVCNRWTEQPDSY
jgi:hypothetical protein